MIHLEESVWINLPVSTVFDFTTDIRNNASWQTGIVDIIPTSGSIGDLGASFRCVNLFLGVRLETEFVVETVQPREKCVYRAMNGQLTGRNTFLYESIDGGTIFTTHGMIQLGMIRLAEPFLRPMVRSQVRNDLQNLKRILEQKFVNR